MNKLETVKDYSDRLLRIANKVRILENELPHNIIVQKILVTLPKRYDTTIPTLEKKYVEA